MKTIQNVKKLLIKVNILRSNKVYSELKLDYKQNKMRLIMGGKNE